MIIRIFPYEKNSLLQVLIHLPAADVAEVTDASVEPAPMMGGPFVSSANGVISDSERDKDELDLKKREALMSTTTKEISIGDIGSRGAEAAGKLDSDKMALNVGPSHDHSRSPPFNDGIRR